MGVLVTCKYDLGRPSIMWVDQESMKNDPYTSIVLYFLV